MTITERKRSALSLPDALLRCFPDELSEAILACGAERAEEIRLHADRFCTVTCGGRNFRTGVALSAGELSDVLEKMCDGSLYAFRERICAGYVTLRGGIRVGVSGTAAVEDGKVIGVGAVNGLMIRIPHLHRVSAAPILRRLRELRGIGGILVYAPPGVGKTTFLRSAAREAASPAWGFRTVVIDAREELADTLAGEDLLLDVLVGYPHDVGIDIAVRNLGAELILCDEIGTGAEARAILSAANRGVPILATAHARSRAELLRRPAIAGLHRARVFGAYAGLSRDGMGGFTYDLCAWRDADADP